MSKKLLMVLTVFCLFALLPVSSGKASVNAAGATGSLYAPINVNTGVRFILEITELTDGAEYIVYVDSTTYGLANSTAFIADGSTHQLRMKCTSDGSTVISLGGSTGGYAASAITSITVTSAGMLDGGVDTSAITDMLIIIIPLGIVVSLSAMFFVGKMKMNRES